MFSTTVLYYITSAANLPAKSTILSHYDVVEKYTKCSSISLLTSWNSPFVKSDIGDTHAGCLNSDFGDIITNGFLKGQATCLLNA